MKACMVKAAVIVFICAFSPTQVMADMYKWVDEKGVIHFQDYKPTGVKPSVNVETLTEDDLKFDNYVESPEKGDYESPYGSLIEAEEKRSPKKIRYAQNQKVELYVTSWCGYCKKAKAFLKSKGISYTEYNIEKDSAAASRHRELNKRGGVPVAVINGKKIIGFSESAYENALKKR